MAAKPSTIFTTDAATVIAKASFAADDVVNIDGHKHPYSQRANRFCVVADGYTPIVGQMGQSIYDRFYVRPDFGRGPYRMVPDRLLSMAFAEELGAVVTHDTSWQSGWTLVGDAPGETGKLVLRNPVGAESVVAAEDFDDHRGRRGPSTSSTMQIGFFHVFGLTDRGLSSTETARIYFNPCREAALPLTATVTSAFNDAGIGYHYKIVDNPQAFGRADGAVLYISADDLARAEVPLRYTYERIGRWLKTPTPLFTKPLAPGVGFAADPGTGESFGMHRSRLVAEGLWAAFQAGATDPKKVTRHLADAFERNGIAASHPYLNNADGPDLDIDLTPAHRTLEEAVA